MRISGKKEGPQSKLIEGRALSKLGEKTQRAKQCKHSTWLQDGEPTGPLIAEPIGHETSRKVSMQMGHESLAGSCLVETKGLC